VQSSNKGVLSPKVENKRQKSAARLEEEAKLGQKVDRNARDLMRDAVRDDRRTHTDAAMPAHDDPPPSARAHAHDDDSASDTDEHNAKTNEHAAVMHELESTRVTNQKKKKKSNSRTNETQTQMRPRAGSATDEWDSHPTQALSRAELDSITNEHELPPSHPAANRPRSAPPPAPVPRRPSAVPVPDTRNAGPIVPSQAVRVVMWQDADGVHVAPAGTVVSAITVDAMLVALDPSADLSAWLAPQRSK
jgi:hypothetical protein